MKSILIIYPHWPPSNLAGVHRPRLVSNYMYHVGWHPIILTVHPKYYEEIQDPDLELTVSKEIEVIYTGAFPIIKPRLIGDIGLRSFYSVYKKAKELINKKTIDFIWIPIPSFYIALIGRLLYEKTRVPYGIDYIDPWVRDISTRKDWRHRLSNSLAKFLEPIAVKKASLISGVAYEYYKPVLQRNFPFLITNSKGKPGETGSTHQLSSRWLSGSTTPHHLAFPYGFDPNDHTIKLSNLDLPWKDFPNCKPIVYAGAFLPKSRLFAEALFSAIKTSRTDNNWDDNIRFFFLGTGRYQGETLKQIANRYQIGDLVHETRDRFPFLHILNFLSAAHAVIIMGSTERHYTASKTFQSLLSKRPVLAIMHEESDAVKVMNQCKADQLLVTYSEGDTIEIMREKIGKVLETFNKNELNWDPDLSALEPYSAKSNAKLLADKLNEILDERNLLPHRPSTGA